MSNKIVCPVCEKSVFFQDSENYKSNLYHLSCIKCVKCSKKLKGYQVEFNLGKLFFCKTHYKPTEPSIEQIIQAEYKRIFPNGEDEKKKRENEFQHLKVRDELDKWTKEEILSQFKLVDTTYGFSEEKDPSRNYDFDLNDDTEELHDILKEGWVVRASFRSNSLKRDRDFPKYISDLAKVDSLKQVNFIHCFSVEYLIKFIKEKKNLVSLDIGSNNYSIRETVSILQALRYKLSLQCLEIHITIFERGYSDELIDIILTNQTIKELYIRGDSTNTTMYKKLKDAIHLNYDLEFVEFCYFKSPKKNFVESIVRNFNHGKIARHFHFKELTTFDIEMKFE